MKQNIYDNPVFFNGYMELRSNERGFNSAVEEPAIYSLLPPLKDLRILDLGCGFGKFVSFCVQKEAAFVLGTDISYNMISEAKQNIKNPYINELIDAGFAIKRLLEPGPTRKSIAERPELSEHLRRPPVLVLAGIKKDQKILISS